MIFLTGHIDAHFEEDEEVEGGIDDALIGELDDDAADDEDVALLDAELDPLLSEEDGLDSEGGGTSDDEGDEDDEEDVDDYDSFDDHDEL